MAMMSSVTSVLQGCETRMSEKSLRGVEQRAQVALDSSPIFDLHDLRVACSGQNLLITGSVSSYYHKQLVQEIVRAVAAEMEVVNSVEVHRS